VGANGTNPAALYPGPGEQVQCGLGKMLAEVAVELTETLNFVLAAVAESMYLLSECGVNGVLQAADKLDSIGLDFHQCRINSVHAGA
jgi:hypothetical protein